jgi:hypothetical protein
MAAGFAAGITEALLIVTPFEVVKIRLQQQKGLAYSQLKYHVGWAAGRVHTSGFVLTGSARSAGHNTELLLRRNRGVGVGQGGRVGVGGRWTAVAGGNEG